MKKDNYMKKTQSIVTKIIVIISAFILALSPAKLMLAETATYHMKWRFYAYSEPNFRAERSGYFSPQQVTILERYNSWILIPTVFGDGWVYTGGERMYINRTMGLFDEIDGNMGSHIRPQVVRILERYGSC